MPNEMLKLEKTNGRERERGTDKSIRRGKEGRGRRKERIIMKND